MTSNRVLNIVLLNLSLALVLEKMAWLVLFFLHARSSKRNLSIAPDSIFPTTLNPKRESHPAIDNLSTKGIEPGPPVQQATALSITPMPLKRFK